MPDEKKTLVFSDLQVFFPNSKDVRIYKDKLFYVYNVESVGSCMKRVLDSTIVKPLFSGQLSVQFRGTQQTVSVNICSEDLLWPTIFGLKYDEKLEFSLAQIFVIWGT